MSGPRPNDIRRSPRRLEKPPPPPLTLPLLLIFILGLSTLIITESSVRSIEIPLAGFCLEDDSDLGASPLLLSAAVDDPEVAFVVEGIRS